MVAVLCAALLLQLVGAADVTSPVSSSVEETKQCLLQQNSRVSKSDAVSDDLHSHVDKEVDSSGSKHGHNKHLDHKDNLHGKKEAGRPLRQKAAALRKLGKLSAHKRKSPHQKKLKKSNDKSSKKSKKTSLAQSVSQRKMKEEDVPEHIMELGMKLFKTKDAAMGAVENSVLIDVTHAGVAMSLRMNKADDATTRLTEEGISMGYDLDTMGDALTHNNSVKGDLLNMIDIGGNYGVVTIAAMKKYAKKLRVVTVEPIPSTFFFLKWNLHINGIPEIEADNWDPKKGTPGVLALNSGSADKDGESLHFCSLPESSMNSKMCDCKEGEDNCLILPSITFDDLGAKFGTQPISMVKMDCEGCEFQSLPALVKSNVSKRVLRFAGELHIPDKKIEELACRWDHGRLVKKCQLSEKNPEEREEWEGDVECDVKLSCLE